MIQDIKTYWLEKAPAAIKAKVAAAEQAAATGDAPAEKALVGEGFTSGASLIQQIQLALTSGLSTLFLRFTSSSRTSFLRSSLVSPFI